MKSGVILKWKTSRTLILIVIGVLAGCSGMDKQIDAVDPRPAYHLVSVTKDGVKTHYSQDGIQWDSFLHKGLSSGDCYDLASSPDGIHQFLAYSHTDENGKRYLNVLRGSGTKQWSIRASRLGIPKTEFCGQPQMRHLSENLYGIMWLDDGSLYSAIYDASEHDGDNLYLSKPVQNDWFRLTRISDLSFAYHNDSVYVVWSPNSKDRIMSMRGDINGHMINYGETDYHLEDHIDVSNIIFDGDRMYIAVVTGSRVNMLMYSTDGSYWRKESTCYNIDNVPVLIPFLYKDARGNKIYLKSNDYSRTVNYLQNFSDCEKTEVNIPLEAIRIEYFPGLHD